MGSSNSCSSDHAAKGGPNKTICNCYFSSPPAFGFALKDGPTTQHHRFASTSGQKQLALRRWLTDTSALQACCSEGAHRPMFDLIGTTALVSGASGTIGGANARTLAQAGARVAQAGTREDALFALQTEIRSRQRHRSCRPRRYRCSGGAGAGGDSLTRQARYPDKHCSQHPGQSVHDDDRRGMARGACDQSRCRVPADPRGTSRNDPCALRLRHRNLVDRWCHRQRGQSNYAASKGGLVAMAQAIAQEVAGRASPSTA
jgi:hypothetical protein